MNNKCPLCNRIVPSGLMEKHHLIPKSKKGKETVDICGICHDNIHKELTNKALSKNFNTIDKLKKNPKIIKFSEWIGKYPNKWSVNFSHRSK